MELGTFSVSLAVKDIKASRAFYEKLGFTREQIIKIYADIFERFNFETRDDNLVPVNRVELDM